MQLLDVPRGSVSMGSDSTSLSSRRRRLSKTGRYRRGRKLGCGGFGTVYQGIDLLTGSFVAIKETKAQVAGGAELGDEIRVLRVLSHENIVKLYDYTVNEETRELALYLELVDGGSLDALRREYRALPKLLLANYTHQLLQGLGYLHQNNVLHLDLKPSNVLVSGAGVVKIVDFGTSGFVEGEGGGPYRGTPAYSAPEAIRGEPVFASDVWSLGVTVRELLTGESPWGETDNVLELAVRIGQLQQPHPEFCDTGDERFTAFVERCCAVDPAKRATCDELLRDVALRSSGLRLETNLSGFYASPAPSPQSEIGICVCPSSPPPEVSGLFVAAHHYTNSDSSSEEETEYQYSSPFSRSKTPSAMSPRVLGAFDGTVTLTEAGSGAQQVFKFDTFFSSGTTAEDAYRRVWSPALRAVLAEERRVSITHSSMEGCGETELMFEGCFPRFLESVLRGACLHGHSVRGACFTATAEKELLFDVAAKAAVVGPTPPETWVPIIQAEEFLDMIGYHKLAFLGVDSPVQICLQVGRSVFTLTLLYGPQHAYFLSGLTKLAVRRPVGAGAGMFAVQPVRGAARNPILRLVEAAVWSERSFNYVIHSFKVNEGDEGEYKEAAACLEGLASIQT